MVDEQWVEAVLKEHERITGVDVRQSFVSLDDMQLLITSMLTYKEMWTPKEFAVGLVMVNLIRAMQIMTLPKTIYSEN